MEGSPERAALELRKFEDLQKLKQRKQIKLSDHIKTTASIKTHQEQLSTHDRQFLVIKGKTTERKPRKRF